MKFSYSNFFRHFQVHFRDHMIFHCFRWARALVWVHNFHSTNTAVCRCVNLSKLECIGSDDENIARVSVQIFETSLSMIWNCWQWFCSRKNSISVFQFVGLILYEKNLLLHRLETKLITKNGMTQFINREFQVCNNLSRG